MTAHVDDREHDTVAEPVVNMSLFAAADQTGVHKFLARVAFGRHRIDERVEGIRCIAESETVHRPSGQTSVDKILLCGSVFRPPECVIIIASGIPAERVQTLSVARRFALGFALLGYLHARPLGEIAYRIREGQTFRLHNKGDDTAACAAAVEGIGSVTTGDAPAASIRDGKLCLTLPRGDPGPQGDPGEGLSDNAKALLLSLLAGTAPDKAAALSALREEWGVADRSTDTETAAAERGA